MVVDSQEGNWAMQRESDNDLETDDDDGEVDVEIESDAKRRLTVPHTAV